MKQISFFQKGTILFAIQLNKVIRLQVDDVLIDIKRDIPVTYKLINLDNNMNTQLDASKVFESIELLKEDILKQFDELTPKEVGECKEERQEETTVS